MVRLNFIKLSLVVGAALVVSFGAVSDHTVTQAQAVVAPSFDSARQLTDELLSTYRWSRVWFFWPAHQRELLEELKNLSESRREAMLRLASEDAAKFLELTVSSAVRENFPAEVQINIEAPVTSLTGTLGVLHIDDFENFKKSETLYFLTVDDGPEYELYPVNPPGEISGARLQVNGWQLGNIIVTSTGGAQNVGGGGGAITVIGDYRLLFILAEIAGSGPPTFTPAEARERIIDGQLREFYDEQSYGQLSLEADFTDWIFVESVNVNGPTSVCNVVNINENRRFPVTPEIAEYIERNEIDLNDYDGIVFYPFHPMLDGGCGSVGQRVIRFGDVDYTLSETWMPAAGFGDPPGPYPFPWTYNVEGGLSHELGHNFGLVSDIAGTMSTTAHADGLDCDEDVLANDCTRWEYGDGYDIMGGFETWSLHTNGFDKEKLGWLEPGQILNINRSGRYTLTPLEIDDQQAKFARVNFGGEGEQLILEYRRAVGFDRRLGDPRVSANQEGLFVRLLEPVPPERYFGDSPHLLDMRPTPLAWRDDIEETTLNVGQSYNFEEQELLLGPVISATPEAITFDVTFDFVPPTNQWWNLY